MNLLLTKNAVDDVGPGRYCSPNAAGSDEESKEEGEDHEEEEGGEEEQEDGDVAHMGGEPQAYRFRARGWLQPFCLVVAGLACRAWAYWTSGL